MHNEFNSLQEYYPKESIPSNYGGSYKSLEDLEDVWEKFLTKYAECLDKDHKLIELESPQKNESCYFNDDLGVNGCFRKLEID